MQSARKRNPFKIVPVTQDMVKDFGVHLSPFFKKTVRAGKQPFNIQKVRILDYSSRHPTQVWVKYGAKDEDWTIFELEKKGVTVTLPTQPIYTYPIHIKPAKVRDVQKLLDKYVPSQYHESLAGMKKHHQKLTKVKRISLYTVFHAPSCFMAFYVVFSMTVPLLGWLFPLSLGTVTF